MLPITGLLFKLLRLGIAFILAAVYLVPAAPREGTRAVPSALGTPATRLILFGVIFK